MDCRKPKNVKEQNAQANITKHDNLSNNVQDINISTIIFECNLVENTKE